jgi:hypothetical protein
MIFPSTTLLRLVVWVCEHLGFEIGIRGSNAFDPLDEREVSEQLHYGRD